MLTQPKRRHDEASSRRLWICHPVESAESTTALLGLPRRAEITATTMLMVAIITMTVITVMVTIIINHDSRFRRDTRRVVTTARQPGHHQGAHQQAKYTHEAALPLLWLSHEAVS
ncbi:hypothetical protein QWY79_15125 [Halomonas sabkhae]|uniref:hypothetical protein n=1 Tax=Halomonas sabkhae TaxID=626223 RepID=UPI0025B3083C|nr:hypothetical protein [Halomonas sabkhae]MDN3526602.1 hypothetical protein [Halomonas sabkhae]